MTDAFTIYWTPEGWEGIGLGNPIHAASGSGFVGRVRPGSRIFVTNVKDGLFRLVGAFTVQSVVDAEVSGKPASATWDAPEYLLAEDGSSSPVRPKPIPADVVRSLRFVTSAGKESGVKFDDDGRVNGQAMRSLRQLTPESAAALEEQLERPAEKEWSEAELRASVAAYLDMSRRRSAGESFVKKDVYRSLVDQFGRTTGSFEYRMQNISYVLSLMGRDWLPGLPPAKNVGARVAAVIERLIGEVEMRPSVPVVGDTIEVSKERKTIAARPEGNKKPTATTSSVTTYTRDAKVKAWVLQRSGGSCEACGCAAPFIGVDGFPFLEVHHVRKLADAGSDTVSNAVALCPNCHRRLHFSEDAHVYREQLFDRVAELQRE